MAQTGKQLCLMRPASAPLCHTHAAPSCTSLLCVCVQTATDYGSYLANEASPLYTSTIVDRCTQKLVDDWNAMRCQVRLDKTVNPVGVADCVITSIKLSCVFETGLSKQGLPGFRQAAFLRTEKSAHLPSAMRPPDMFMLSDLQCYRSCCC